MKYGVYQNARNASWGCLLDCRINTLPISVNQIAWHYGIRCKKVPSILLGNKSGEIQELFSRVFILYNADHIATRQRFTVMHELGHYLLGHLGDEPLSRSESDCKPEEEQAADKFAIDVLAPACVLWGLNLHTAEEIAQVCNISMQAAQYRADRMELLYRRNMFLTHPLERQVFEQFRDFIQHEGR